MNRWRQWIASWMLWTSWKLGRKTMMGNTLTRRFFHGFTDSSRNRSSWFDTRLSYNPAIHRMKQALFHSAIVPDLAADPLPEPHPELTKYLEPPTEVLEHAKEAIDGCKTAFAIKKGVYKITRNITSPYCAYSTEKSCATTQERPCARSRR